MTPEELSRCPPRRLAGLIRPSGYFNIKARRLLAFLKWLVSRTAGDGMDAFRGVGTARLRKELLAIQGIGPETADSILLYALGRRSFVVDAYTRRVLLRHGLIRPKATYDDIKRLFEISLPPSKKMYNECHALLVRLGKQFCRPTPRCEACPVRGM